MTVNIENGRVRFQDRNTFAPQQVKIIDSAKDLQKEVRERSLSFKLNKQKGKSKRYG